MHFHHRGSRLWRFGVSTPYARADEPSLHGQNASKIKWHQANPLYSRSRPDSPAMQLRCSHLETTKVLSVHREGAKVKTGTSNNMQDHSLAYLGPLYSSLLHFWEQK